MRHFTAGFLFFIISITQLVFAQIPQTISYQGILTDNKGGPVPDGNVSLTFKLYNASEGGDTLWQETQSVMVTKGIFNVVLGSVKPLNLPFDEQYWLGITIEGDEELSPRTALTASPYSLNSHSTITEPVPGQGLVIKNDQGEVTHQLSANGDVEHTGTGTFLGGIVVGDTAAVSFDSLTIISHTSSNFKKRNTNKKTLAKTARIGVNAKGTLYGVLGESDDNIGVYGFSYNHTGVQGGTEYGIGVSGISMMGHAVDGYSRFSYGVFGNTENGDAGVYGSGEYAGVIGKGGIGYGVKGSGNSAGVWANGTLIIDSVPPAPQQDRFLVWDSDHYVKYRTLPSGGGSFDGILVNKPFVVENSVGDAVFRVDTSGASLHKGDETFEGDVILKGGKGKGIKLIDGNGTTLAGFGRTDLDTGQRLGVYGRAQQPGDLAGAFDGDVDVRGEITATSLHIVDADKDTLVDFFDDGTSLHKGLETYQAGLKVTNTDGSSAIELVPNTNPVTEYGLRVNGNVKVNGILNAQVIQGQTKQFRIDDPLDPEHKYLSHTSVESSEMKNVYDGEVVLDKSGEAVVSLPEWFQALNKDYRYQLTCVGGYAPVYVKEEIHNNRFKIAGGQEGLKICWQVTGVRNDKFAREHRMQVITNK